LLFIAEATELEAIPASMGRIEPIRFSGIRLSDIQQGERGLSFLVMRLNDEQQGTRG
jgi:hypothetical protein